jgi:hypothetical protein
MQHFIQTYGSWCLAPFGILGMIVSGRKKAWGWLVSLCTQALWATYAIVTGQDGFLVGTFSYTGVYAWNWFTWAHPQRAAALKSWLRPGKEATEPCSD